MTLLIADRVLTKVLADNYVLNIIKYEGGGASKMLIGLQTVLIFFTFPELD